MGNNDYPDTAHSESNGMCQFQGGSSEWNICGKECDDVKFFVSNSNTGELQGAKFSFPVLLQTCSGRYKGQNALKILK